MSQKRPRRPPPPIGVSFTQKEDSDAEAERYFDDYAPVSRIKRKAAIRPAPARKATSVLATSPPELP